MMQQLDMASDAFLKELEKTKKFTDKVCKQFGWEYHPNHDVDEGDSLSYRGEVVRS